MYLSKFFDTVNHDVLMHRVARKIHDKRVLRTLATQTGMTNQWLREQGLISIKELWVNIHYPAKAR
jgi:retron-type reverse transcriptase